MAVGHVDSGNGIRRAYSRPQTRPTLGIKATVSPRGRRPLKKRSATIIPGELPHHGLSATKSAALAEPRDPERRLRLLERPLNSAPSPERPSFRRRWPRLNFTEHLRFAGVRQAAPKLGAIVSLSMIRRPRPRSPSTLKNRLVRVPAQRPRPTDLRTQASRNRPRTSQVIDST